MRVRESELFCLEGCGRLLFFFLKILLVCDAAFCVLFCFCVENIFFLSTF